MHAGRRTPPQGRTDRGGRTQRAGRAADVRRTERIPLGFVGPDWLVVVAVVAPLAVVVANALAVWPGRRATRRAPANDLRTE